MIVAASIVIALGCVLASARRLYFVAAPTALHPDDVLAALDRASLADLRDAAAREPSAEWERDLFAALSVPAADTRAALVNEQLTELDLRMKRWDRVPRVCASVATSAGIMLATLVMRRGLVDAPELTGDMGELFVRSLLNDAVSVASFGVVGTAFCIATHTTARRLSRDRADAADRMVERLESLVSEVG